jgi:hypothetical protein
MTTLAFVAGILLGGKRACFSPSMFGAWAMPWDRVLENNGQQADAAAGAMSPRPALSGGETSLARER